MAQQQFIGFVFLTAFSVATMRQATQAAAENPNPDMVAVVQGNTAFALDLYHRLAEAESANCFFSPSSISTALAMTYGGAVGETAKEIAKALYFPENQEKMHVAFAELLK